MSLEEELAELSLVYHGQREETEELRELVRDAAELLGQLHDAMARLYGTSSVARAPLLTMIEAWQVRAKAAIGDAEK